MTHSRRIIVVFVAIIALLLAFLHLAIYEMLMAVFAVSSPDAVSAVRIILTMLWASFIGASLLSNAYDTAVTRFIYRLAAGWLGFAVLIFMAAVPYSLAVIVAGPAAGWTAAWGGSLLLAAVLAGISGLIHAGHIMVTREIVRLPGLPASWKGKTVVLVSDLHLGQVRGAAFAGRVAAAIEALRPDIVFVAGDLYDGVKVDADAAIAPLSQLSPPRGIYFVTGNHEEFGSNQHFLAAVRKIGMRVLANELTVVDGLQIAGVLDRDSSKPEAFSRIMSGMGIDRSRPSILIKHQPTLLSTPEQAGISLQVSGHTHRAQMWPFYHLTRRIFKGYDYGLHRFGAMQVLTSSGVGTWGPPMRIGTKAEVVAITLEDEPMIES